MHSEKSPPRNLSALVSSPRVFLIILILLVLILISRTISSSDPYFSHSTHKVHKFELTPRDYLNESSINPAPFEFCPHYGPGDKLVTKYGALNLAKSKVFMGTGARMQRVIHRALSGLPITMSVIGGSVTACHGAGDNPISPNCYPSRFFEWWNTVFPHPASELTNGAMRRTNSAYYSFCSAHHLPDKTDLVILEFDTEDDYEPTTIEDYDLLIRSILSRPNQPAVLVLGNFSPQLHDVYSFNDPSSLHNVVAQFYDVPHVSSKGLVFNEYATNPAIRQPSGAPSSPSYWVDPLLSNSRGHELIADVLINYFQEMTCKGWSAALGTGFEVPMVVPDAMAAPGAAGLFGGQGARKGGGPAAGKQNIDSQQSPAYASLRIPPIRVMDRITALSTFREPQPFCVSANDLINPLPPSLFSGSGWHAHNPSPGNAGAPDVAGSQGYYWYSTIPTSRLRVPVKMGAGDVGVYYLLEPKEQFSAGSPGIKCWVDDNVAGATEIDAAGDVSVATPALVMIDKGVSRGSHFVECQLLGDEGAASPPFKILGVFAT